MKNEAVFAKLITKENELQWAGKPRDGFQIMIVSKFEKEGERYPRIRNIFSQGLWEYYGAARNVSKFIGGIKHSRHHVGAMDRNPFVVIPADDQRRALKFLDEQILGADVFAFESDLLNKLAPERLGNLKGTLWSMDRLDFPIHRYIKSIQRLAIYSIVVISSLVAK